MTEEITITEAAKILRVSIRQVGYYVTSGRIVGRRLNPRMWLVSRASVMAFVPARRGRRKAINAGAE